MSSLLFMNEDKKNDFFKKVYSPIPNKMFSITGVAMLPDTSVATFNYTTN